MLFLNPVLGLEVRNEVHMYNEIKSLVLQEWHEMNIDPGRLQGNVQNPLLLSHHDPNHWSPVARQSSLFLPVFMILVHVF